MDETPTSNLENFLASIKPSGIKKYFDNNKSALAPDKNAFSYYFKNVLETKNIKLKDVYIRGDFSESYGSKLLSGEKHTKKRDTILRLCLAGKFSLIETNRALKLYGLSPLYAKDKRDACLIVCLNNSIYDFNEINDILDKQGLKKILLEKE